MNERTLHTSWIGLGTNLGNRKQNLETACASLDGSRGEIIKRSSYYESSAVGFKSDHLFYNMCLEYRTALSESELLFFLHEIEHEMGRKDSTGKYTDRLIDLDILMYDDLVLTAENLIIPHPRLHERKFVLHPLAEISPLLLHPLLNLNIQTLLDQTTDRTEVRKLFFE